VKSYCEVIKKPLRQRDYLRPKMVDRKLKIENELRHAENAVVREFKVLCMAQQVLCLHER
jgi:hypothetical protein